MSKPTSETNQFLTSLGSKTLDSATAARSKHPLLTDLCRLEKHHSSFGKTFAPLKCSSTDDSLEPFGSHIEQLLLWQ